MENEDLEDNVRQDLGTSIIDSALDSHVLRGIGDLVDVAFNTKTLRSILSLFPPLETALKGYEIGHSLHDDLFVKKILGFIKGCGNLTEGEKENFREQLGNADYRRRAGENILLILDRLDNFDKPELLGKVFAARVRGEIDEDMFYRLATTIINASITDLKNLRLCYEKIADEKSGIPVAKRLDDVTSQSLYNVGLVRASGFAEIEYLHNELGTTLIGLMKQ